VLPALWNNLQAHLGEPLADHIRGRIRILAAGGDGTVAWVMKTIKDLDLHPAPAIAIMPLGTGALSVRVRVRVRVCTSQAAARLITQACIVRHAVQARGDALALPYRCYCVASGQPAHMFDAARHNLLRCAATMHTQPRA
jgi:hypothetical protein